jgi:hypothetical protein
MVKADHDERNNDAETIQRVIISRCAVLRSLEGADQQQKGNSGKDQLQILT